MNYYYKIRFHNFMFYSSASYSFTFIAAISFRRIFNYFFLITIIDNLIYNRLICVKPLIIILASKEDTLLKLIRARFPKKEKAFCCFIF